MIILDKHSIVKFVRDQYRISASAYNQELFSSIVMYKTTFGKVTTVVVGSRGAGEVVAF
jgi:hypothetical protein